MTRKLRQPVTGQPTSTTSYPTLSEHRASRRRFLQGSLAVVGAGALAVGCEGFFPRQLDGAMPEPNYHACRFPESPEDRAVWLLDGGYARFYAVAMTYDEDVALWAQDERDALTDRIADELSDCTYDELSTASGRTAVCNRLRLLLDDAYNENTGDVASGWIQDVELTFTQLDAPEVMGGVAPEPSYP